MAIRLRADTVMQRSAIFVLLVMLGLQSPHCVYSGRLDDVFRRGDNDNDNDNDKPNHRRSSLSQRIRGIRLYLWARGHVGGHVDGGGGVGNDVVLTGRLGPVSRVRRDYLIGSGLDCVGSHANANANGGICDVDVDVLRMRGGGDGGDGNAVSKLEELSERFGDGFREALRRNEEEHAKDCAVSCEAFYCAPPLSSLERTDGEPKNVTTSTTFVSYHFGPTPPEDFAEEFGFPLDLIKVSSGHPLFSAEEAARVVETARSRENLDDHEYVSGKYKLGGAWLVDLPHTRAWFNTLLETTLFPLLAQLFPEVVSHESTLRAHSVSLLKYNATHPRTDVHVDNGVLAMTLAMTPQTDYTGGGTFFEHFTDILEMDAGHGTFRPGSVRHGGHRVTAGTRYVLGAFLLLSDRVEHVRRLKNRGSELRRTGDLEGAATHFEWALAINPRCTTCLKDWAEMLLAQKQYDEAETKIRRVLQLLEDKDSDALFTLGVILSEQGRDDESIEAYTKSVQLNAEDAELCYNLGIKLGAKGDRDAELRMYGRAVETDPSFGGAWLNWGTVLAEANDMDGAADKFLRAMDVADDKNGNPAGGTQASPNQQVKPKAMMNLGLLYQKNAQQLAAHGRLDEAKTFAVQAGDLVDAAKPLLETLSPDQRESYRQQYGPVRLQCHRTLGSVLAGLQDFEACEAEFRRATQNFPTHKAAWQMLLRVLDLRQKTDEAAGVRAKLATL